MVWLRERLLLLPERRVQPGASESPEQREKVANSLDLVIAGREEEGRGARVREHKERSKSGRPGVRPRTAELAGS